MKLDKKQIWAIFLFEFKMGHKAAETTHNSHSAFSPGTANRCVVQWWFKKFCKSDESLEDEEHTAWSSKVDSDNWEDCQIWSSYNYTKSCWSTQHQPFYGHWAFEANWKDGKLHKWVPHELTKNFEKIITLKCLLILWNSKPFLDQIVTCIEKRIVYNNQQWPAQWLDQEEDPQNFPKPNLHQRNVHGHCLGVSCPSDPPYLSESRWNYYIEKYAQQVWMRCKLQHLQPALVNRKGPIILHYNPWLHVTQPMFQKLNELGYKVLSHLPYSPALLPTDYHFFKHLNNPLQWKCFHNQQEAENAFPEFVKSWRMDFHAVEISKLISYWQNVLIVMAPILIKKCLSLDIMI